MLIYLNKLLCKIIKMMLVGCYHGNTIPNGHLLVGNVFELCFLTKEGSLFSLIVGES